MAASKGTTKSTTKAKRPARTAASKSAPKITASQASSKTKPPAKEAGKAPPRPSAPAPPPAPKAEKRIKVPFPKKGQPPSEAEFVARLPLAIGKKFEAVRGFLRKQKRVTEELYYYGPKTGWAYRYLRDAHSVGTIMIHDERLMGIVSLDPNAAANVAWPELSPVGQRAKRMAHGSPALLWLDLPLEGSGADDFKQLLKAKLKALPPPPPPPPPGPPIAPPGSFDLDGPPGED
jgi:hypothetical protein